jgi:hypothetical protein
VERLGALVEHAAPAEQRGVVDQDVDLAPTGQHVVDIALDGRLVGDIAGSGHRLALVAFYPGDAGVDRLLGHVVAGDLGAVLGQGQSDAAADVRPDAGDESDLTFEGYLHR